MSGVTVRVYGAEEIALVARAVRQLGDDRTIVNEMARDIRAGVPAVRKAVRAEAVAILPAGGGLGRWVAAAPIRAAVRRSGRSAGVEIVGSRKSRGGRTDLRRIDAGAVRAPAWGNRRRWHSQPVTPGFFSRPAEASLPAFRAGVVRAVDRAVAKLI